MRQLTFKTLKSCPKPFSHRDYKDFFGIGHVTSKDIAGAFKSGSKLAQEPLNRKYQPLMQPRETKENKEYDVDVTFGRLRIDDDNVVRTHGQFEPTNERKLFETTDIKQRYVPIDLPPPSQAGNSIEDGHTELTSSNSEKGGVANYNQAYRISEVVADIDLGQVLKIFKTADTAEDLTKYSNNSPLTFFFKQTMKNEPESNEPIADKEPEQAIKQEDLEFQLSGRPMNEVEFESVIMESSTILDKKPALEYDPSKDQIPLLDLDPDSEEYQERSAEAMKEFNEFDKSIDEEFDIKERPVSSKNALDYLKDIRAQRIEPTAKGLKHRLKEHPYSLKPIVKLDSKGFRVYTHQVPDWTACRRVDILNHIQSAIVYNNYDILAVNKPYGIPSHPHLGSKGLDMDSIIQELAKKLRLAKVYLAHRLDKDTTGVLLFATSQKRALNLNKLFKADEIKKTYWCLTKGVPDVDHAIIDIPIGSFKVAGKIRACVVPEKLSEEKQLDKKSREAKRAITEYKILKTHKNAALVEVKPRSGVKHQIRCHMSFGLNAPILGDHKYSHLDKVAPQRLPPSILSALHMRQSKSRTLPMHLHAKSIVIPGAKANGETLFINAPLPQYYVDNLKTLGLWDPNLL